MMLQKRLKEEKRARLFRWKDGEKAPVIKDKRLSERRFLPAKSAADGAARCKTAEELPKNGGFLPRSVFRAHKKFYFADTKRGKRKNRWNFTEKRKTESAVFYNDLLAKRRARKEKNRVNLLKYNMVFAVNDVIKLQVYVISKQEKRLFLCDTIVYRRQYKDGANQRKARKVWIG